MQEKKRVPKLRFPEFTGEWSNKKLKNISSKINDKNKDNQINTILSNSAVNGIVLQSDFFDREITSEGNLNTYYIVNNEDFVYNPRISKYAPVGPIHQNKIGFTGIVSPLYTVFRVKKNTVNKDFLYKYFSTSKWHRYMKQIANYGARHDRMNITLSDLFDMPLSLPSVQEQEKIASFLSKVDEKIEKLERKKELWEEYKKGVMQKIFSQEIRFRDDEGQEFCEWEGRKLVDYKDIENGDGDWILSKDICNNGDYNIVQLGNIGFGKFISKNFKTISKKTFNELKCSELKKGDLLINRMVSDSLYTCILDKDEKFITSVDVCWIRKNKNFSNYFLMNLLLYQKNQNRLLSLSSGSGRVRISKINLFNKFSFYLPSLPEQEKISNFLSNLDTKIDVLEREIERNKEFKRGLLQQMFV